MTVKAVQNDNSRGNVFASVMKATVTGGVTGYIAKQVIPLTTEELKDIPYRAIINAARKDTNKNMVAKLNGLESRTLAQDTFIKMVDEKNFKNAEKLAEGLANSAEKNAKELAKEFKEIIKTVNVQSKQVAKNITGSFHKMIKCKRPTAAFVVPGAIAGFVSGAIYNAFKHTDVDASEENFS